MKLSIVIATLNSHEIIRREMLYFQKIGIPNDDVEVIYVDDGSDIPIKTIKETENIIVLETHDKRLWTQPLARNMGARAAKGEYLFLTDVDHIIPRETIDFILDTEYDVVRFRRKFAVLDENGDIKKDKETLKEWGILDKYLRKCPPHGNSFALKKSLYWDVGGVIERYGKHPNREEAPFKGSLSKRHHRGEISMLRGDGKPLLYTFPNGRFCGHKDYNPFGFFHNLERNTRSWNDPIDVQT